MSETWLEKQMFSIKDIKKIILVSTILSNQDLVEECGLSRRHIQSLHDSLIKSLIKTIDEFYEEQKNEEEAILEVINNQNN